MSRTTAEQTLYLPSKGERTGMYLHICCNISPNLAECFIVYQHTGDNRMMNGHYQTRTRVRPGPVSPNSGLGWIPPVVADPPVRSRRQVDPGRAGSSTWHWEHWERRGCVSSVLDTFCQLLFLIENGVCKGDYRGGGFCQLFAWVVLSDGKQPNSGYGAML